MLAFLAAHSADGAHRYRIQHRRNGSHIILAQQQRQQPHKSLRLPNRSAQHIVKLLQGRQQNIPQLIEDLGAAVVTAAVHTIRHFLQFPGKVRFFQEIIESTNLLRHILGIPEPLCQPGKGLHQLLSCLIEPTQQLPGVFRHLLTEAVGVVFPCLQPAIAPDAPDDGIVFQPVANILGKG